jgi:hypothetical protein
MAQVVDHHFRTTKKTQSEKNIWTIAVFDHYLWSV